MTFENVRTALAAFARSWSLPRRSRIEAVIAPEDVIPAARALFDGCRFRFLTISAMDERAGFVVLYHFADDPSGAVVTLRTVLLDKDRPRIASLAPMIVGADWIEREIREMLGIEFTGHPDPRHLLLSDDWPAGDYPLRQGQGKGRHGA